MYLQWYKPAVSLFCTAALSRGQLHFAKSRVALHCCWATAHLSGKQISIGVFAVAQACCQPVLHSSTEQGATALCQKQRVLALLLGHCTTCIERKYPRCICSGTSLGVFAVAQACFQPVLHSSAEQGAIALCQKQCGLALLLGHCTPVLKANLHRCICSGTSLLSACLHSSTEQGATALCQKQCGLALLLGHCTTCQWKAKQHSIACICQKQWLGHKPA